MHRITELRRSLNLKQIDLANRILTTQGHISDIENGRKELTGRAIKLICSEFNVREEWLRTGNGEMFDTIINDELEGVLSQYNLPDMGKRFVKSFIELDAVEMKAVLGFMEKVVLNNEELDEMGRPTSPRKIKFKEELEQTKDIVSEIQEYKNNAPAGMDLRIARSENHAPAQWVERDASFAERIKNAKRVTSMDDA